MIACCWRWPDESNPPSPAAANPNSAPAAQALARVRCPEVPAYLFAPERCPGAALRVGSGDTRPAQLIRWLKASTDPLLGELEAAAADGAWLQARAVAIPWPSAARHHKKEKVLTTAQRLNISNLKS